MSRDFDQVVTQTASSLRRLAWLMVLNASDAEELTQEAYMRLWADWDELCRHPNHEAWLTSVVTNLARDRYRRSTTIRRKGHLVADEAIEYPSEIHIDLHRGLARLSLRQRQCVALRYWADLTIDEIATHLGLGSGSVAQHLSRAKRRLGSQLGRPID